MTVEVTQTAGCLTTSVFHKAGYTMPFSKVQQVPTTSVVLLGVAHDSKPGRSRRKTSYSRFVRGHFDRSVQKRYAIAAPAAVLYTHHMNTQVALFGPRGGTRRNPNNEVSYNR